MSEFGVTFVIEKTGDREALRALDALDKTGRQIVENVANATGRAMGDIAHAYTTGGNAMKQSLIAVSDGWRQQQQEIATTARAVDALEGRQAHSIATASRGLEMIGRTGQLTGRSLDAVVGQISAMAFSFGPTGQIVAAVGITTAAVVELFMRTSKEAKKLADETAHEFARIAHMDVAQQGDEAARLYSGDKFAERKMDRLSIPQMKKRMAELQASLPNVDLTINESQLGALLAKPEGSPTHKIGEAMKELDELDKEMDKRENIRAKIMGMSGSMADAGKKAAAVDHWSFLNDDAKAAERAGKKAELAAIAAEKQAHRLAVANAKIEAAMAVDATKRKKALEATQANEIQMSLVGLQSNIKQKFEAGGGLSVTWLDGVQKMAEQMERSVSKSVGDALANGFETAFSSLSLGDGFKALTATVLSGIGSMMEQVGESMIGFGSLVETFKTALIAFNGGNMILAGVEMIAAGALLKSVSGSISGSIGAHVGSSGGGYSGASGLASIIDRGSIPAGSYSSTKASDIQPRPNITNNFTVMGHNDPTVVRFIDECNRKALQAGSLAFNSSVGAGR
ncbi:hypothetical protein BH11GEM2_BH11GEM2_06770 [soil metagenome]